MLGLPVITKLRLFHPGRVDTVATKELIEVELLCEATRKLLSMLLHPVRGGKIKWLTNPSRVPNICFAIKIEIEVFIVSGEGVRIFNHFPKTNLSIRQRTHGWLIRDGATRITPRIGRPAVGCAAATKAGSIAARHNGYPGSCPTLDRTQKVSKRGGRGKERSCGRKHTVVGEPTSNDDTGLVRTYFEGGLKSPVEEGIRAYEGGSRGK